MFTPFIRLFDAARERGETLGVRFTQDSRPWALSVGAMGVALAPAETFEGSVAEAAHALLGAMA